MLASLREDSSNIPPRKHMPEIIKDQFGPEYIVKAHNPRNNLEGYLVIDNTVLGPGKGGIRMTSDITV